MLRRRTLRSLLRSRQGAENPPKREARPAFAADAAASAEEATTGRLAAGSFITLLFRDRKIVE